MSMWPEEGAKLSIDQVESQENEAAVEEVVH
jgi:hypothetical protein